MNKLAPIMEHLNSSLETKNDIIRKQDLKIGNLMHEQTYLISQIQQLKGALVEVVTTSEEKRHIENQEHNRMHNDMKAQHKLVQEDFQQNLENLQAEFVALQSVKSQFDATVRVKCEEIKNKDLEIAALKQETDDLLHQAKEDKNACAVVQGTQTKVKIKHVKDECKQNKPVHRNRREEMDWVSYQNKVLTDKLEQCEGLKKNCETHCNELLLQIQQLQSHQKKFEADLLECISVITEPQLLQQHVNALQTCYVDDAKQVHMSETTEAAYKFKISSLQKELECFTQVKQCNDHTMEQMEEIIYNKVKQDKEKEGQHIK